MVPAVRGHDHVAAIRLSAYPPIRSGGPRTESIPLPRHPPGRSRRDHLRVSGWLTRRAGSRDLGWEDRRAALRGGLRQRAGRLARHRLRADDALRRGPGQGLAVAPNRPLRYRRGARRRGAPARPHRPQDVARLCALPGRRDRCGDGRRLTARSERLRLRHEAHRGPGSGAALVSRAASVGPNRFPAGAVAAQVPPRLQAAVHHRRQPGAVARRPPHRVDRPSLDHDWPGVDFLGEGLRRAFALLLGGDAEVSGVVLLTLKVAVTATLIACAFGLPLGFFLATRPFWGRRAAFTLVNTALAFPTVVTGLLLFGLLSRRGPLGGVGWLYTWQAIALGDVCIALPIAAALSAAAVQGVDPRIRRTAQTLGASAWRTAWAVAREARFALAAVITAAFGHVIAEIGSAMIVGGNIRGSTRTLTTAIALYTGQGEFGLALALGVILLVLALLVNIALQVLQGKAHA